MKYQSQNGLIDPDDPGPSLEFEFENTDESELQDDAYVMDPDGNSVERPGGSGFETAQQAPHRWVRPAAFLSVALFVVLTAWNLGRLAQGPPLPPKPTAFQSKQALYLGVLRIEAYRRVHGVVPDSLAEAGLAGADAYDFKRVSPTRYVLSFRNRGAKIEYDSIEPTERYFGSAKDMLTMGDSQ